MNVSFTPSICCRSFAGKQEILGPKFEQSEDTFEKSEANTPRMVFSKNQIDKFVKFYCEIEDEFSKKLLRYCLQDDEERYGEILDKLDEAEGTDRNIKEKKSFTRKFLDLMMLPEFYDTDARDEAVYLAKLPIFDDGKNKDVQDILLELAVPPVSETVAEEDGEAKQNETEEILADNKISETYKPKKLGIFKRAITLFSAK